MFIQFNFRGKGTTIICAHCGEPMIKDHPTKKFCDTCRPIVAKCRSVAANERAKARTQARRLEK